MGKASLDLDYKIEILGEGARFDLCGSCGGRNQESAILREAGFIRLISPMAGKSKHSQNPSF